MKKTTTIILALTVSLFLWGCGSNFSEEGPKGSLTDPPAATREAPKPLRIALEKDGAVLKWPEVTSAAYYRVEITGDNGRRETFDLTGTTYTDSGISKGVLYTYIVTACDGYGTVLDSYRSSARLNDYGKTLSDET